MDLKTFEMMNSMDLEAHEDFSRDQDRIPCDTELHLAVRKGEVNECEKILSRKECNVNELNAHGSTALHIAAEVGIIENVKILLENGASVSQMSRRRETPLSNAVLNGRLDVVKYLVQSAGADPYHQNLLLIAIHRLQFAVARYLMSLKTSTQDFDPSDCHPIHNAAMHGAYHILRYLILLDFAHIDERNVVDKETALSIAVRNQHPEICKLLIDHGANVFAPDQFGTTSLDLSTSPEITEMLKKSSKRRFRR